MNRVCISGRLGQPPRLSNAGQDNERLNFSVAINQGRGERQTTNWLPVVVFGKAASVIADNVVVGQELHISGRLEASPNKATRSSDDGRSFDEPIWGVIADAYEGVTFGRRPGEGASTNGNGGTRAAAPVEEEAPF